MNDGFLCIIFLGLLGSCAHGLSTNGQEYVSANNHFTLDLLKEVGKEYPKENIFMSPYSVMTALSMILEGANNNTEKQMVSTLHLNDIDDISQSYKDTNGVVERESSAYTLDVANRLFAQDGFSIRDEFLQATKSFFGAEAQKIDFAESDKARETINHWVEDQTNRKIRNLIPSGVLDSMTKLVLVNAIYFKADWEMKFNKNLTTKSVFHTTADDVIDVDMMSIKGSFSQGYDAALKCKILELPYTNKEFSMFIILPDSIDGVVDLESNLTVAKLETMKDAMRESEIQVHFPRFKITEDFGLKNMLSKMGMSDLFTTGIADLSDIDGTRNLYVLEVVHKAYVDINEDGTEAAAASAIVVATRQGPPSFSVTHPFLMFIQDNTSGAIIFIGRVMDPSPPPVGRMSRMARLYQDDDTSSAVGISSHWLMLGSISLLLLIGHCMERR